MKRTLLPLASAALIVCALPTQAKAQDPWTLEFRGGAAFPTGDAGDDLDTGIGLEGTLAYRLLPHLAVYGGWDWHRFTPADEGASGDLEETGYAFGLRWEHPLSGESGNGLSYRVHAGGTYNHLELEDEAGDVVADSGHGLGWEAGAGLTFPLAGGWRLTPGVRYRSLSRDLEVGEITSEVELTYLAVEVGLSLHF